MVRAVCEGESRVQNREKLRFLVDALRKRFYLAVAPNVCLRNGLGE